MFFQQATSNPTILNNLIGSLSQDIHHYLKSWPECLGHLLFCHYNINKMYPPLEQSQVSGVKHVSHSAVYGLQHCLLVMGENTLSGDFGERMLSLIFNSHTGKVKKNLNAENN